MKTTYHPSGKAKIGTQSECLTIDMEHPRTGFQFSLIPEKEGLPMQLRQRLEEVD